MEKAEGGVWTVELNDTNVKVKDPTSFHGASSFSFDRVFPPECLQKDVYDFVGRSDREV